MDDPIYADKYAEGASKRDLPGKIKQALDARHTKYLEGWLISGCLTGLTTEVPGD